MTVSELIEKLKEMPPDLPVCARDRDDGIWSDILIVSIGSPSAGRDIVVDDRFLAGDEKAVCLS